MLALASGGRKDKNDVLLEELTNSQNWKQALIHVEKRFKRGDQSSRLLVNKIYVLLGFEIPTRTVQALAELEALAARKPPIVESELIDAIELFADRWPTWGDDAMPMIDRMWEQAVKERPRDEILVTTWFESKFTVRNYKNAQKAATAYSKNFPEKRRPYFWNILACHLASKLTELSAVERKFFSEFAYKLLAKAASLVPAGLKSQHLSNQAVDPGETSILPLRALQNPGELQLLVEIYESQGRYDEALAILNDPRTGLTSAIGHSSWELVREKIALNDRCGCWEDQWQECYDLLMTSHPAPQHKDANPKRVNIGTFGDDWAVWSGLITATAHLKRPDLTEQTKDLLTSYLDSQSHSRNTRLGLVFFYDMDNLTLADDKDDLLSTLRALFFEFSTSSTCFSDLLPAHNLSHSQKLEFLASISQHVEAMKIRGGNEVMKGAAWITAEINSLKQQYTLMVSVNVCPADNALLEALIAHCLRLYKISLRVGEHLPVSERQPGDDAAILAAMCCVHLFRNGQERALIRCVVILEVLLSHSIHNYDALLMIVRVYIYLGAFLNGLKYYVRLDVKHIQFLTNSWILFTRVSTIHPSGFEASISGVSQPSSPAYLLQNALQWATKNTMQVENGIGKYLEHDTLVNLLKHLDYGRATEGGPLVKYSILAEFQRIARLRHGTYDLNMGTSLAFEDLEIADFRNTNSFPNYEAFGQPTFEQYLRPGPTPGRHWVISQLRITELMGLLSGVPAGSSLNPDGLEQDDMTEAEQDAANWVSIMLKLIYGVIECKMGGEDSTISTTNTLLTFKESVMGMSRSVERMKDDPYFGTLKLSKSLGLPFWNYFHTIFTYLDLAMLMLGCLRFLIASNGTAKRNLEQESLDKQFEELIVIVNEVYDGLHNGAAKLQGKLEQKETIDELKKACLGTPGDNSDAVGRELGRIIADEAWLTSKLDFMVDGWFEALGGILKTDPRKPRRS